MTTAEIKRVRKALQLTAGENIIMAAAQSANGPGWSNSPIWVIVQDRNGNLCRRCLQPAEQSSVLRHSYAMLAEVQMFMMGQLKNSEVKR